MLKSLIRLTIIICLIYLWVLNPIPFVLFEDTLQNQNQSISQSQQIMFIRSGAFDKEDNPYKKLFQRKTAEGQEWYKAMPFVCAALARHIYHCLKFNDPYDVEKAFRGASLSPASEEKWLDLGASLDEKFEVMEAFLCQIEG